MAVRAVTFDADGTLWDFATASRAALDRVVVDGVAARPELSGRLTAEGLQAAAQRLFEEARGTATPLSTGRRRSFHLVLRQLGVHDDALADALADRYLALRHGDIRLFPAGAEVIDELARRYPLGLVTNGNTHPDRSGLPGRFAFQLRAESIGIGKPDLRVFHMAAAAAGCRIDEVVHVGDQLAVDVVPAQEAGARAIWLNRSQAAPPAGICPDATIESLDQLPAVLAALDAVGGPGGGPGAPGGTVGVGPHRRPWPVDPRLDPVLLADGDRRNVVDRYRYWRTDAVVADLDARRHPFHVAVENWRHDLNIGTVVRNANAFLAAAVHVIGNRRWNRRGAMVTDRYQHVLHHRSIAAFVDWTAGERLPIVAVDNLPGSVPLDAAVIPERCVFLFGQEGPGLSADARAAATAVYAIRQFGSTRSINAGVASGIAMHAWVSRHRPAGEKPPGG